ncbi:mucoidy inhibitor MuiA family protein [Maritimibacter sp. HL-12]|uniref:mucoidy inhibitor MuiA family protein n=1 Tax=Maritimibacter sp. HL-12 TaxID=1162418 RepID=UPI000A0F3758|nr:mucoidy inhibitor MuiA family protein [Maritimibacter sp. HL-12]SMH48050.1 conserved hypothetical protein [Maritimibacter sp. HL-12]
MRLLATSLIALAAAVPALAEDVVTQAPVAAATVFPAGAELTLRASVDLPAGDHRVFLPYSGLDSLAALPRIRTSQGVEIGAIGFRRDVALDRETLFTDAQAEAWEAVERVRENVAMKKDETDTARAELRGLEARLDFMSRIEPGEEMAAEDLFAMADRLRQETGLSEAALVEVAARIRPLEDALKDLRAELAAAEAAFARLSPPEAVADMLTVEVSVAEAGPVTLELTELTSRAWWEMDYDLDLNRAAGEIAVARKVIVTQETGRVWDDVDLTLSTARPGEEVSPTPVEPDRARIVEPMDLGRLSERSSEPMLEGAMPAPMMVEEADMKSARLEVDGLALSYVYPDPVTIASAEAAELALDRLTLDAEAMVHAAPRWDDTAFTVARFVNTTGEPLLPGNANILRDGHLVGRERLAMIPAGAEAELGFGPIEGIRLTTVFERNQEGDAGFISKSNTRDQLVTFTVENLTDEAQDVRAFFPLTFSEQDDLRVRVTADPAPSETDIEKKRGVSAWDLTVAPGETAEVEITIAIDWPEGMELIWNP